MGDHDSQHSLAHTSRSAERMIEERIDELRAIALGPIEDDPAYRAAQAQPPAAARQAPPAARVEQRPFAAPGRATRPARATRGAATPDRDDPLAAVLQPVTPAPRTTRRRTEEEAPRPRSAAPRERVAVVRDREEDHMTSLVSATVSRIELAVQEDVARIEELLRAWGPPGDHTTAGAQRVERSLRAELARILEAIHSVPLTPNELETALDSAVEVLDIRTSDRHESVRQELHTLVEALRDHGDQMLFASSSAAETVGTGVGDRVARELHDLADPMISDLDRIQQRLDELIEQVDTQVSESGAVIAHALGDGMTDVADAVGEGLAATGTALTESEQRVIAAVEQLREDSAVVARDELGVLSSVADGLGAVAKVESTLGQRIDDTRTSMMRAVDRLDASMAKNIETAQQELEQRIAALELTPAETVTAAPAASPDSVGKEWLDERLEELEDTLLVAQDEIPEELLDRLERATAPLQTSVARLESNSGMIDEQIAALNGRIESLRTDTAHGLSSVSEAAAQIVSVVDDVRSEATSTSENLLLQVRSELEYNRVSSAERLEQATAQVQQQLSTVEASLQAMRDEHVVDRIVDAQDHEQSLDGMISAWRHMDSRLASTESKLVEIVESLASMRDGQQALSDLITSAMTKKAPATKKPATDKKTPATKKSTASKAPRAKRSGS